MRRTLVGNWMRSQSLLLFVFAIAILFTSGSAFAADAMKFRDLKIEFYVHGEAQVHSVTGILAATDSDSDYFGDRSNIKGDGKFTSTNGTVGNFLKNKIIPSAIMANFEKDDPMTLVAVIEDVTQSVVQNIQQGVAGAAQSIIDLVTADLSAKLFGDDASPSLYTALHPTSVTGVGVSPKNLGISKVSHEATAVVVMWQIANLKVSATASANAAMNLAATMAINKGALAGHLAHTNQVGVETKWSRPEIITSTWSKAAAITNVTDTVSNQLNGLPAGHIGLSNDFTVDGDGQAVAKSGLDFNVRTKDQIHFKFVINPHADLDGEPDRYFGTQSDELALSHSGSGLDASLVGTKSYGGAAYIDAELADGQKVYASNPNLTYTKSSNFEVITVNNATRTFDFSSFSGQGNVPAGIIGEVSTVISDNLVAAGISKSFKAKIFVADDAGSATSAETTGYADTAPLYLTRLKVRDEFGVEGGEVGSATDISNDAAVSLQILPGGEEGSSFAKWLHISVKPNANLSSLGNSPAAPLNKVFTRANAGSAKALASVYNGKIYAASQGPSTVDNIPSGQTSGGVTATIWIRNDQTTSTALESNVIVSVSDDARNPAIAYTSYNTSGGGISSVVVGSSNALIDSSKNRAIATTLAPLVAREVKKSTVSVDNMPPEFVSAVFSVRGMPAGFWNNADIDAAATFALLRSASETALASVNSGVPVNIRNVLKGTAKISGTSNDQNGSPVRMVVTFKPTITSASDTDHVVPKGSDGVAFVKSRFKFDISSPDFIGMASQATNDYADLGWSIVDATVHNSNIGYVTFEHAGLPSIAAGNKSINGSTPVVSVADRVFNSFGTVASSSIVVDVTRPVANLTGIATPDQPYSRANLRGGVANVPAQTVFFVTNTVNTPVDQLSNVYARTNYNATTFNIASLGKVIGSAGAGAIKDGTQWINSVPDTSGSSKKTVPEVQSGYMLIVSATFTEPIDSGVDINSSLPSTTWRSGSSESSFPYVISGQGSTGLNSIDAAKTTYGRSFRTISANFSDFILTEAAKDVLPQVTSVVDTLSNDIVSSVTEIGAVGRSEVIAATWYYLLKSEDPLNTNIADTTVRAVTFTARDLSGNVTAIGVPLATAAFVKPVPEIWAYEIRSNKRPSLKNGALIQKHANNTSSSLPDAFAISSASTNIEDTMLKVVVRVPAQAGTSTDPKFDFVNTKGYPVQADIKAFGGNTSNKGILNPNASRVISAKGQDITILEATAGSVVWATFDLGPFKSGTGNVANAKVIVRATGRTLGIGSVQTTEIVHDGQAPTGIALSEIIEQAKFTGDSLTDSLVRPNQPLLVRADITLDNIANNRVRNLKVMADLSDFGLSNQQLPKWTKPATKHVSGSSILYATWLFTVPANPPLLDANVVVNITDAAYNFGSKQNTNVQVDATKPSVVSNILSASVAINYITDTQKPQFITHQFPGLTPLQEVGRKELSIGTTLAHPSYKTVVKNGDWLRITSVYNVNDPVFTTLTPLADFTSINGSANVTPQATRALGGILHATWTQFVGNVASATEAIVTLSGIDPAGETVQSSNVERLTVPIMVDNTKPVTKVSINFFKNGNLVTGKVNPNNLTQGGPHPNFLGQVGNATFSVIVEATYTDKDAAHGYAGSVLAAALANKGVNMALKNQATTLVLGANNEIMPNWLKVNADEMNPSGVANEKILSPSLWIIWGDGPMVWGGDFSKHPFTGAAGNISLASSGNEIRQSTNAFVTAYFGTNPWDTDNRGYTITEKNNSSANVVGYVTDTIGNVDPTSSGTIKLDGTPPTFNLVHGDPAIKRVKINDATLSLSTAKTQTAWVDYVPSFELAGQVIRPTKVRAGTWLQADFTVNENPTWNDPLDVMLETDRVAKFGGRNFSVINGITATAIGARESAGAFTLTPAVNPQPVVIEFQVNTDKAKLSNTWDIVDDIAANDDTPFDAPFGWGFAGNLSSGAYAVMTATDTLKNDNYSSGSPKRTSALDLDKQGPFILDDNVLGVSTLSQVNGLMLNSSQLSTNQVNYLPSNWLVYAATLVVDGTEEAHLKNFLVDWSGAFEVDTNRFVRNATGQLVRYKGRKTIVASATRTVLFVTDAVQIKSNSSPSVEKLVKVTMYDALGNKTEKTQRPLAINARGPRAVELTFTVNGVSEVAAGGAANLGIGNRSDTALAQFEFSPGDVVSVEALVTTIGNQAPDTILLDLSDLYPPSFKTLTDEIVPSATSLTTQGSIKAVWDKIAYDFTGVVTAKAGIGPASRMFADQSVLQAQIDPAKVVAGHMLPGDNTARPLSFNGILKGVTPATSIDSSIGAVVPKWWTQDAPSWWRETVYPHTSIEEARNGLMGLPNIVVQEGAMSHLVTWVTVTVDDNDSLFAAEDTLSAQFALDASHPIVEFNIPSSGIVRKLPAMYLATSNERIGYPSAPNIDPINQVPNRVIEGDVVDVIVNITNTLINGTGNDDFRQLPGLSNDTSTMFDIDTTGAVLDVSADFSDFNAALSDVVIDVTTPLIPATLSITHQAGQPSKIRAEYELPIGGAPVGDTMEKSRDPRSVTVTVVDDAGNKPYNTPYDFRIKRQMMHNLSVDNTPPSISGVLDVVVQAAPVGSDVGAIGPANQELKVGQVVPGGSKIIAGTVLRITATVTARVDSPIDVLNNPNYGRVSLDAQGIELNVVPGASTLAESDVVLDVSKAVLSGPESIAIPFIVQVPSADSGFSTSSFKFIIHATDTVGNTASKPSNASFGFDAKPVVTTSIDGTELKTDLERTLTVNAGSSTTIKAAGFDVGGVTSVRWIVPGSAVPTTVFTTVPASDNFENVVAAAPYPQNLDLDLVIEPQINESGPFVFVATAAVMDNLNNESFSGQHILNINQPALFASVFEATAISSAGAVLGDITSAISSVAGLQISATEDVREVTVPEGSTLTVDLIATDMNIGTVSIGGSGSALDSQNIKSAGFVDVAAGLKRFTFEPGFLAVSGTAEAATYVLHATAGDGLYPNYDNASLLINVLATPATPEIQILTVSVNDGVLAGVSNGGSVIMRELQTLQVVVQATDEGNDALSINVHAPESVLMADSFSVASATGVGVANATITFTPDAEFSDLPGKNNADDPFSLTITAQNLPLVGETTSNSTPLAVDVVNESQPPIIATTVSVNGGAATAIADGNMIKVEPSSTLVFKFKASDPDGETVQFPTVDILNATDYTSVFNVSNIQPTFVEAQLTLNAPATVAPSDATASIVFHATDATPVSNSATYYVVVNTGSTPVPADIDELFISTGQGGQQSIVVRNVDPNSSAPVNGNLRGFRGTPLSFLEAVGGGFDRAAYLSSGDVNNDNQVDMVVTLGPIVSDVTLSANIVIVRDAVDKAVVGHPFYAFPDSGAGAAPYAAGELKTTVGNFIGSSTPQIAVAQGVGGNQVVRLFQYTGLAQPNGWKIVGSFLGFDPFAGPGSVNNASKGVNLAAADIDGDGVDELFVAQTRSNTSRTAFNILDIEAIGDAGVAGNLVADVIHRVTGLFGFHNAKFRGNGGIELKVDDITGDGVKEIVVVSTGDIDDLATPFFNLMGVLVPKITAGTVTGVDYLNGYVMNTFSKDTNPSGGISMALGELDGNSSNGKEIVITTNALQRVDGMNVESVDPAPVNKYLIIKVAADGTRFNGWTRVALPSTTKITPLQGVTAFVQGYAPTSGALYVATGNSDAPQIGN